MMPVLQGYTNDGLLMNNFRPESDWRHKHKLLLSTLLYYTLLAPVSFPVVIVILVGLISLSWRRETWKMPLGTVEKLVHLSVCASVPTAMIMPRRIFW
jgi:hypothetical protein